MEKSFLLENSQPGSPTIQPNTAELTTGTRHAITTKANVERIMMKKTTQRVRFPASSTYSLWSGIIVGYGKYTSQLHQSRLLDPALSCTHKKSRGRDGLESLDRLNHVDDVHCCRDIRGDFDGEKESLLSGSDESNLREPRT